MKIYVMLLKRTIFCNDSLVLAILWVIHTCINVTEPLVTIDPLVKFIADNLLRFILVGGALFWLIV